MSKLNSSAPYAKIKSAALVFTSLMLIWLGILMLLSVFELVFNGLTHEFPKSSISVLVWSWLADFFFWLEWLWLSFVLFVIVAYFSERLATILLKIYIVILVLLQLGLINYFNVSLVPLGADFYGYSFEDIKQTVGASGGIGIGLILSFVVVVSLVIWLINAMPKKIKISSKFVWFLPLLSILFLIVGLDQWVGSPNLKSEFANNLAVNKAGYFLSASYSHFFPEENEVDIYADSYIGDFDGNLSQAKAFNYTDEQNFPFLHQDETPDVLTPFFNIRPHRIEQLPFD